MPAPGATPSCVIIVDNGELADVRLLLAELKVEYRDASSIESIRADAGCGLLITSARRALVNRRAGRAGANPSCRLHVVVYDTMSGSLRRVLAQSSCDVVLGRPIHPAVFRLLVAHALYDGPERRLRDRVAMQSPVKLRVGRQSKTATLVQLSLHGCGLVAHAEPKAGLEVQVTLPPELTGGAALTLRGCVVASALPPSDGAPGCILSVRFHSSNAGVQKILKGVMVRHGLGTTASRQDPRRAPRFRSRAAAVEAAAEPSGPSEPVGDRGAGARDQRTSPRKLYPRRVLAASDSGTRMLIGRDLSAGGMRVRPVEGLEIGDELKIAIYSGSASAALVVKAVVARDDGWEGLVLRFEDVGAKARVEIERLMESLPATRQGKGIAARAPGVVVSEILEHG